MQHECQNFCNLSFVLCKKLPLQLEIVEVVHTHALMVTMMAAEGTPLTWDTFGTISGDVENSNLKNTAEAVNNMWKTYTNGKLP